MPMGTTHRTINTVVSVPVCAGALFLGWTPAHVVCLAGGYTFATFFMNPDLDLNSLGYKSWGWLRIIWWPYQRILAHRCWISHFPVISTILRVIYLMWFPLALLLLLGSAAQSATREAIFDWWPVLALPVILFIVGMIISDSLHAILDTSSTELKHLMHGSHHSHRDNFFAHHNQAPPRRVTKHYSNRRTPSRRRH
ncbi:MAG TPA: metal-binding protein [Chloroflexia bacterium]|nr:metal-binding protein [Chloroflexia bacterium]